MGWARMDDGFHDHPKVDGLSLAAVGLWTLCWSWANRHRRKAIIPGHVPQARVEKVAGRKCAALAGELVRAGLWDPEPNLGGYVFHDFVEYLPKERDPEERREAGSKGAAKRWSRHRKLPSDDQVSDSSRVPAPASPTRPDPSQVEIKSGGNGSEVLHVGNVAIPPCSSHGYDNDDGNCHGCRRVRVAVHTTTAAETSRLAAIVADCQVCDDAGRELDDDRLPTGGECGYHEPLHLVRRFVPVVVGSQPQNQAANTA